MSAHDTTQTHEIQQFPEALAVVRLAPGAEIPTWAESSSIFSITATSTETSLVCAAHGVPVKAVQHGPLTGFAVAQDQQPGCRHTLGQDLTA